MMAAVGGGEVVQYGRLVSALSHNLADPGLSPALATYSICARSSCVQTLGHLVNNKLVVSDPSCWGF